MQNVALDNGVPIICKVCTSIMQNVALDNKAPVIWKVCLCHSNLQCIMWHWIIKILLLVKCALDYKDPVACEVCNHSLWRFASLDSIYSRYGLHEICNVWGNIHLFGAKFTQYLNKSKNILEDFSRNDIHCIQIITMWPSLIRIVGATFTPNLKRKKHAGALQQK